MATCDHYEKGHCNKKLEGEELTAMCVDCEKEKGYLPCALECNCEEEACAIGNIADDLADLLEANGYKVTRGAEETLKKIKELKAG